MSKAQRRAWEIRPDDCAVIRTQLLSKSLSSEKPTQPRVNLPTTKRNPLLLCVGARGFVFSQTLVFRIQTRVLRMSHESDRLAPQGAFPASL